MAYVRMKEAGRDAARNVIKNMSKMFPRQKPSMVSNKKKNTHKMSTVCVNRLLYYSLPLV